MKEPVSLDLFSDDVCPSPSEFMRLRVCRDRFFYAFQASHDFNFDSYLFFFWSGDARLALEALGGLGGVW